MTHSASIAHQVVELTDDNFALSIQENPLVVVDFWAPWCGPCRGFAPVFEKSATQHPDVLFARVNVDQCPGLSSHFRIRSIPTLIGIARKQPALAAVGALAPDTLERFVQDLISGKQASSPEKPHD